MLRNLLFTLCLLALGAPGLTHAEGRKLAIVVGVDTYRANSDLPPLKHAGNDAASLSAVLRQAGFTVYEMTQSIAGQPGKELYSPQLIYIRDQIDVVLDTPNLGKQDTILISLHGHGVQFDRVEGENKTAQFYFCPADATVREIKTANQLTDRNRLLPLNELYASLGKCKAATKLLIVDACRNDPTRSDVFRSGLASSTLPKLPPPPSGIAAFFSCKENQRAVEDPELKHGVFTHFLVEGLKGKADFPVLDQSPDGIITLSELQTYVANNTYAYVMNKYPGIKQSPGMKGEFDTNLPLTDILLGYDPDDPDYLAAMKYLYGNGVKIDKKKSLQLFQAAADRGHPIAMAELGFQYIDGDGVTKDKAKGEEWIRKSIPKLRKLSQDGVAEAQLVYGSAFYDGILGEVDYNEALKWYRKAADQGYAPAQSWVGSMYRKGEGVEQNYTFAMEWYLKAAEQGLATSQHLIGYLYNHGHGVEEDYDQAMEWYLKAAEQGYATAQNNIGVMYRYGYGVEKDYDQAMEWYLKAAEQGHATAQSNIGYLYLRGYGVEKDYDQAMEWFQKSVEQNNVYAQSNIGLMYRYGYGVEKDYDQAMEWYLKAAEQGHASAQSSIGSMYRYGSGIEKDYDQAMEWYLKAADQGYAFAQYSIGNMYRYGYGVEKDLDIAKEWYRKAADQGYETATNVLKRLEEE